VRKKKKPEREERRPSDIFGQKGLILLQKSAGNRREHLHWGMKRRWTARYFAPAPDTEVKGGKNNNLLDRSCWVLKKQIYERERRGRSLALKKKKKSFEQKRNLFPQVG